MSFSPQLFLSNIKIKDGLAKPSRFEIILPIPAYINTFIGNSIVDTIVNAVSSTVTDITNSITNAIFGPDSDASGVVSSNPSISRYLALQCETAELPGKTLATTDVKIYGPTFKVPYQTQYNDITLGFLCTNDFYERKLFERWIESIMPSDTHNLRYPKGNSSRYLTNITIIQYDEFIKQIFAVELLDAFPIGIAAQPLSWSEDNFHRLNVQFAYQKYRVKYRGTYDLAAVASSLFGVAGTRLADKLTGRLFT
jgi:hypothetical protein